MPNRGFVFADTRAACRSRTLWIAFACALVAIVPAALADTEPVRPSPREAMAVATETRPAIKPSVRPVVGATVVPAMGLAMIGAFGGSILLLGWWDGWFRGRGAAALAGLQAKTSGAAVTSALQASKPDVARAA